MDKSEIFNERFYYEEPFYRKNMSPEEFRNEKNYLNENMDMFYDGSYVPLWRQEILRKRKAYREQIGRYIY
jgi:hypothetical protein